MKKFILFTVLTTLISVYLFSCSSEDDFISSNYEVPLSRAASSAGQFLSQRDAFKLGSGYLKTRNGLYQLALSSSQAVNLGISPENYNIMKSDIDNINASLEFYEIKASDDVIEKMLTNGELSDSENSDESTEMVLDSLVFEHSQGQILKTYGENLGYGSQGFYSGSIPIYFPQGCTSIIVEITPQGYGSIYNGSVVGTLGRHIGYGWWSGGFSWTINVQVGGCTYYLNISTNGNPNIRIRYKYIY